MFALNNQLSFQDLRNFIFSHIYHFVVLLNLEVMSLWILTAYILDHLCVYDIIISSAMYMSNFLC